MRQRRFGHNLIIVANLLIVLFLMLYYFRQYSVATAIQASTVSTSTTTYKAPQYTDPGIQDIADRVNSVRVQGGTGRLSQSAELDQIATMRANDMANREYYAHKSPEGSLFNNLMDQNSLKYSYACENLNLADSMAPSTFVESWLASQAGHRECLLENTHTKAGYAISHISSKNGILINQTVVVAIYSD